MLESLHVRPGQRKEKTRRLKGHHGGFPESVEEIPGISMFYKKAVVNRVICGRITEGDQDREIFS